MADDVKLSQHKIFWNTRSITCASIIGGFSLVNLILVWYLTAHVPKCIIAKYNAWNDAHGLREDERTGKITFKYVVPAYMFVPAIVPVTETGVESSIWSKTIGKINTNATRYQRVSVIADGETEIETEMRIYLKC